MQPRNECQQPYLLTDNCPNEPIIPHSPPGVSNLRNSRLVPRTVQSNTKFAPKNIKLAQKYPYPYHHSFEEMEHQRQLKCLRIKIDCIKNRSRKPHHEPITISDSIMQPLSLTKDSPDTKINDSHRIKKQVDSLRCKKKLISIKSVSQTKNKPRLKRLQYTIKMPPSSENPEIEEQQSVLPTPIFHSIKHQNPKTISTSNFHKIFTHAAQAHKLLSKNQTQGSGNLQALNLPCNSIAGILNHIYNHRIYKESDLQILEARLKHNYGPAQISNNWNCAMKLLQISI